MQNPDPFASGQTCGEEPTRTDCNLNSFPNSDDDDEPGRMPYKRRRLDVRSSSVAPGSLPRGPCMVPTQYVSSAGQGRAGQKRHAKCDMLLIITPCELYILRWQASTTLVRLISDMFPREIEAWKNGRPDSRRLVRKHGMVCTSWSFVHSDTILSIDQASQVLTSQVSRGACYVAGMFSVTYYN